MTLVPRTTLRTLFAVLAALLLAGPTSVTAVPLGPGSASAAPWSAPISSWSGQPPDRDDERDEADEADEDDEREDDLYDDAYDALNDNDWVEAVELFDSVIAMAGPRVDAAMYWSAYARTRQGLGADALETLAELAAGFPDSRYLADARALEVEVREQGGQPPDPEQMADEELKLLAIQGLQNTDPERALPLLERLLRGPQSPQVKGRALFVLAHADSERAATLLTSIAQGSSTPDLQLKAIHYLGMANSEGNRALLADIYAGTGDVAIKTRVLRAFVMAGDTERVFQAATSEADPTLRGQAIRMLGMLQARDELRLLYEQDSSKEQKLDVLRAMFLGGDSARLVELLDVETDAELRRAIIRNLGLVGDTGGVLRELYAKGTDSQTRRAVVQSLFIQQADTALVELARAETDRELLRDIVRKLSLMNSDTALDFILELLER